MPKRATKDKTGMGNIRHTHLQLGDGEVEMGRLLLCLGGVKSGKSAFVQARARQDEAKDGRPVLYLATAEAGDQEMRERIERHRRSRPSHWVTAEEPLDPAPLIQTWSGRTSAVILDCLTLLLTNLLLREGPQDRLSREQGIIKEIHGLLDACKAAEPPVYLVANDVGPGLIASTELGRRFQDLAGSVHQLVAAEAHEVYYLVAGLPQRLK